MKLYIAVRTYDLDTEDPQSNADAYLDIEDAIKQLIRLDYKPLGDPRSGPMLMWEKRYEGVDDPPVTGRAYIKVQDLKINIREL